MQKGTLEMMLIQFWSIQFCFSWLKDFLLIIVLSLYIQLNCCELVYKMFQVDDWKICFIHPYASFSVFLSNGFLSYLVACITLFLYNCEELVTVSFIKYYFVCFLLQNGDRLFIGAPGSWYWQGKPNWKHSCKASRHKENYSKHDKYQWTTNHSSLPLNALSLSELKRNICTIAWLYGIHLYHLIQFLKVERNGIFTIEVFSLVCRDQCQLNRREKMLWPNGGYRYSNWKGADVRNILSVPHFYLSDLMLTYHFHSVRQWFSTSTRYRSKCYIPIAKTLQLKVTQWNFFRHIRAKCNLSIEINLHLGGIRFNCTWHTRMLSDPTYWSS